MKTNHLLVLLALFSVVSFGCAQIATSSDEAMMEKGAVMNKDASAMKKDTSDKGDMMESRSVTVNLIQQSDSGQTGQLVLSDVNGKTKAVLTVTNAIPDVEQPAHLHESSCEDLGPIAYPLDNIINSRSETLIDVSLDQLLSELPLAVNVHKSVSEAKIYSACGNITSEGMSEQVDSKGENSKKLSYTGKALAGTTSRYIDFNKADYENALKENKKILLYFYANWCPLCKKEQPETFAAFDELNDPNLVGFRVNYKDSDTDADEEALAKEFGIAYQHTKVILKDGKQVAKYPDSWNRQRYLDELAKV